MRTGCTKQPARHLSIFSKNLKNTILIKKNLLSYLEKAADWKIKDILKKNKVYRERFISSESQREMGHREGVEVLDGLSVLEIKEAIKGRNANNAEFDLTHKLTQLFNNKVDHRMAELVCAKVRSTLQYVAILGISGGIKRRANENS